MSDLLLDKMILFLICRVVLLKYFLKAYITSENVGGKRWFTNKVAAIQFDGNSKMEFNIILGRDEG